MDPAGKVALITGGGSRLGRAISLGLAQASADVVIHYHRSAGPAEETAAEAREVGAEALVVQADLGRVEAAEGLGAKACVSRSGRPRKTLSSGVPRFGVPRQRSSRRPHRPTGGRGTRGLMLESIDPRAIWPARRSLDATGAGPGWLSFSSGAAPRP